MQNFIASAFKHEILTGICQINFKTRLVSSDFANKIWLLDVISLVPG